jgi:hypothetical protein
MPIERLTDVSRCMMHEASSDTSWSQREQSSEVFTNSGLVGNSDECSARKAFALKGKFS